MKSTILVPIAALADRKKPQHTPPPKTSGSTAPTKANTAPALPPSDSPTMAASGTAARKLSKVVDARTADKSAVWFKVYGDPWSKAAGSSSGDSDMWANKDMNKCYGRVDFTVPAGIPSGDYLVRAETIPLHTAGSCGQAQLYASCFTVSGGGSASPLLVNFPGAYKASDPGNPVNIHASMSTYVDSGPNV